jgi:hypothetical protein
MALRKALCPIVILAHIHHLGHVSFPRPRRIDPFILDDCGMPLNPHPSRRLAAAHCTCSFQSGSSGANGPRIRSVSTSSNSAAAQSDSTRRRGYSSFERAPEAFSLSESAASSDSGKSMVSVDIFLKMPRRDTAAKSGLSAGRRGLGIGAAWWVQHRGSWLGRADGRVTKWKSPLIKVDQTNLAIFRFN